MEQMSFTERLGLRRPIVQAPMAGVSTPELAAAVCEAGALGSIAIGAMEPAAAREAIRRTRALTDRPFNVNVFAHRPSPGDGLADRAWAERLAPLFAGFGAEPPAALREIYPSFHGHAAFLEMLCEERPGVVSFHFGCPAPDAVEALHASGAFLMGSATDPAEALALEDAGLDAVILQGWEAGGHRGLFDEEAQDLRLTLDELLGLTANRIRVPLVAAGGLMSGGDIARVLAHGAAAAQLGTAFVACPESAAGAHYRERMRDAAPGETVMTRAISGRPARGFATAFTRAVSGAEREAPPYPYAYDAHKQLAAAAAAKGDPSLAAMWAGTGVHRARPMPAGELVERLEAERAEAAEAEPPTP